MGAYGAALYALDTAHENNNKTTLLSADALKNFRHDVKVTTCGLCENHCRLTVNTFDGGRKFNRRQPL